MTLEAYLRAAQASGAKRFDLDLDIVAATDVSVKVKLTPVGVPEAPPYEFQAFGDTVFLDLSNQAKLQAEEPTP